MSADFIGTFLGSNSTELEGAHSFTSLEFRFHPRVGSFSSRGNREKSKRLSMMRFLRKMIQIYVQHPSKLVLLLTSQSLASGFWKPAWRLRVLRTPLSHISTLQGYNSESPEHPGSLYESSVYRCWAVYPVLSTYRLGFQGAMLCPKILPI